jgi:hypothetical protein
MILKNNNGKLELYKDNGALWIKYPFIDVKYADLSNDEELVLVTFEDGNVELFKANGAKHIRFITNGEAKEARFAGDDVVITYENGKSEQRGINGSLKRTF